MHHCDTYTFARIEGLELQADVYHQGAERKPAVVYFHGGGGIMGTRRDILGLNHFLQEGFTVISPDYRLAPESKLPDIVSDAMAACRWVNSNSDLLGIDPENLTVAGFSFGGYLALLLGVLLSPSPKYVLSFSGYGELSHVMYRESNAYYCTKEEIITQEAAYSAVQQNPLCEGGDISRWHLYLYSRQQPAWYEMVCGTREESYLRQYSPARHLTAQYPPTCLVHGLKDEDVPYDQSVSVADQLRFLQRPCELITLDGMHGVGANEEEKAWRAIHAFLKKVSGGDRNG